MEEIQLLCCSAHVSTKLRLGSPAATYHPFLGCDKAGGCTRQTAHAWDKDDPTGIESGDCQIVCVRVGETSARSRSSSRSKWADSSVDGLLEHQILPRKG